MNVYEAMMKAADYIQNNPDDFSYEVAEVPDHCGSPGCVIGWTGFFMGLGKVSVFKHCHAILGVEYGYSGNNTFTGRMDAIEKEIGTVDWYWRGNAEQCSAIMRVYAKRYHAPASRPTSALVADLMVKVNGARIPDEVAA